MDSGFRRNDGFWTFDEFIKLRFPAFAGITQRSFAIASHVIFYPFNR
jgi:hypothetical protein